MEEDREMPWNFHTCKLCSYRSKSTFVMCKHVRLHGTRSKTDSFTCEADTPEGNECEICEFDTNLKVDLTEHIRVFHEEKAANEEMEDILKRLRCENCNFKTHSVLVLTNHDTNCKEGPRTKHNDVYLSQNDKSGIKVNQNMANLVRAAIPEMNYEYTLSDSDYDDNSVLEQSDRNESAQEKSGLEESNQEDLYSNKSNPNHLTAEKGIKDLIEGNIQDEEEATSNIRKSDEIENIEEDLEEKTLRKTKKFACLYCQRLIAKIAPHLESQHKDEPDVKKITSLPKGCKERKSAIEKIRKEGNYLHNKNKTGDLIVCRRKEKTPDKRSYTVCSNCRGYFMTTSFRKHYRFCTGKNDRKKGVLSRSRAVEMDVHSKACDILKERVLPVLLPDEISDLIRCDEFLISYGNKMCCKRSPHLFRMIRIKLRLLGRFLLEMKKIQPIVTCFSDIFDSCFYNETVAAINFIAGFNESTGKYRAPATAFRMCVLLKQCTSFYIFLKMQGGEVEKQRRAEDYLKVLSEDLSAVNKGVTKNQQEYKRQKN